MPGDPFEDHVGPFYTRRDDQGIVCGFMPSAHNCNGYGNIHGGTMMTFGEVVHGVTVTMNCEFISGATANAPLYARGQTIKAGRSLIFVRGTISQGNVVLAFSGTIKRVGA